MKQLDRDLSPEEIKITKGNGNSYATLVRFKQEPRRGILQYITVAEEDRRQGHGSHLFELVLEKARHLNCKVVECIPLGTVEAQSFWKTQTLKHKGYKVGMVCLFPLTLMGKLHVLHLRLAHYLRYLGL